MSTAASRWTRPRGSSRLAAGVVAVILLVSSVWTAAPAVADPIGDAVSALRGSNVYVGSQDVSVDQSAVSRSLPANVKIAVLPSSAGSAQQVAQQIGEQLDPNASGLTVGVVSGHSFGAASARFCSGFANSAAQQAVQAHRSQLQSDNDVTATLQDFAQRVANPPKSALCGSSSASDRGASGGGSGGSGWVVVGVIALLLVLGIGGLFVFRGRSRRRKLDLARAHVQPYYDRLADDLNTIDPGDNPRAKQAIADASQRFTSAGSMLASADSVEKYAIARRTVLEGLYSTRAARVALGLDPGADLPALDGSQAPQLNQPQQVTVQGQTFQGYPAYTAAAPYYFGGGWGVPGGWYGVPFWETLLLGSALGGGFGFGGFGGGWGWGGGGFGSGYDAGYESGYDAGRDSGQDQGADGGDWGNSGGGDWGNSGGGDWGGGDWGGGGGDWGGGGGNDSGGGW